MSGDLAHSVFVWRNGLPLADLTRKLVDYVEGTELSFNNDWDETLRGRFFVSSKHCGKMVVDDPWLDDPWLSPSTSSVSCRICLGQYDDLKFYASRDGGMDGLQPEINNTGDKIFFCLFSFGGGFHTVLPGAASFQRHVRLYGHLKMLYEWLEADEVFICNPHADSTCFPLHRDKILRLAKEGTQVLVRNMEYPQDADTRWEAFIYIDPPGVQGPTFVECVEHANREADKRAQARRTSS